MRELQDFYAGKKVFLTGGTGFKGAWLCMLLHRLGAKVYDYSLAPPSEPSLWDLAHVAQLCTFSICADILEKERLKTCMIQAQPDIFIHLAAQSLVRPSYEQPYATLQTNIMGTAAALEAALACSSVKSTLIITSDKAYENIGKPHLYTEKDSMGGHDPYSASKGCAELVVQSYRKSFFDISAQGLASVRAGNVIGGGDFAKDRLIPDMAKAFKQNSLVEIRYPHATRPWQHVLDPLYGYLLLAKKLYTAPQDYSGGWNFGPLHNESHSVEEVVRQFSSLWDEGQNRQSRFTITGEKQPHEASFLGLDCGKACHKLDWTPRLVFQESIAWTAKWYRDWSAGAEDLRALSIVQIEDFLQKSYDFS